MINLQEVLLFFVYLFILFFAGTQCHEGQPVYPEQRSSEDWNGVFPDGVPLGKDGDKKPPYVFVWKTWGMVLSSVIFSMCSHQKATYHKELRQHTCPIGCLTEHLFI